VYDVIQSVAENSLRVIQRSNREQHPIVHNFFECSCVRISLVTDCNSRMKHERNTKLRTHSEMKPHYQWRLCPLPILYAFRASTFNYSWRPIIDNFTYVTLSTILYSMEKQPIYQPFLELT